MLGGHRLLAAHFADARAAFVAEAAGPENLAEIAVIHPVERLVQPGARTALRAGLDDLVRACARLRRLGGLPSTLWETGFST